MLQSNFQVGAVNLRISIEINSNAPALQLGAVEISMPFDPSN